MTTPTITVIGGGLAGLVASITAAEAGASVDLYERHVMLGGRARSSQPPYVANLGPHVVYSDGPLWDWLDARGLATPAAHSPKHGLRFRYGGKLRRTPPAPLLRAIAGLWRVREAPVDVSFHAWVADRYGETSANAIARFAGVVTFTADPGALSAAFVWERVRRVLRVPPAARYVLGGWSVLVDRLEAHAHAVGVTIHLDARVDEVNSSGPVVVATEPAAARRLLGDDTVRWTCARTVLLDIGVRARRGDPFVVSDLDEAGWAERFSAPDPSLAPAGHSLLQAQVGARPGETLDAGVHRLEQLLDLGFPQWRAREVWRRRSIVDGCAGALDTPRTTWRDRPRIERHDGVFLCGDYVAAPGLLGEVAWSSAVTAATGAVSAVHLRTEVRSRR